MVAAQREFLPQRRRCVSDHQEVAVIEVVEVLADLGDDGVAGDRRTVAVIDEQPGRLVVDDAMGERLGLLADVELVGAERPLGQALEDIGIENDLLVLLIVDDHVGPPLDGGKTEVIEEAGRRHVSVEDIGVDAAATDILVPPAATGKRVVARPAFEHVLAAAAGDRVIAVEAGELVLAAFAVDLVLLAGGQRLAVDRLGRGDLVLTVCVLPMPPTSWTAVLSLTVEFTSVTEPDCELTPPKWFPALLLLTVESVSVMVPPA